MTVFVIFNPAKKPTPSATIAKIARYRPKLCLISRNVVFPIMDLIKKPPFSLADLPLNILYMNDIIILNHTDDGTALYRNDSVRHCRKRLIMGNDYDRLPLFPAGILQ